MLNRVLSWLPKKLRLLKTCYKIYLLITLLLTEKGMRWVGIIQLASRMKIFCNKRVKLYG